MNKYVNFLDIPRYPQDIPRYPQYICFVQSTLHKSDVPPFFYGSMCLRACYYFIFKHDFQKEGHISIAKHKYDSK